LETKVLNRSYIQEELENRLNSGNDSFPPVQNVNSLRFCVFHKKLQELNSTTT